MKTRFIKILQNYLTDPVKRKTLSIKMQKVNWDTYHTFSNINILIRHFAYWLSLKVLEEKYKENSRRK